MKSRVKPILEAIEGAILIGLHLLLYPIFRQWRTKWGASKDELERSFPGDEFIPNPKWGYTHTLTIHTSTADIWPWIVQIGQGRGGFYSYELLENLVGCNIRNTDRILPDFQKLNVGDSIWLHPRAPALPVAAIEPGRFLLLGTVPDYNSPDGRYLGSLWLFFLQPRDEQTTRFILHGRNDYKGERELALRLVYGPFPMEPIAFVMGRKTLLTVKRLAEAMIKRKGKEKGAVRELITKFGVIHKKVGHIQMRNADCRLRN